MTRGSLFQHEMSLELICWVGHYAKHGDQHGRSKATYLGADQGRICVDLNAVPFTERGMVDSGGRLSPRRRMPFTLTRV
jgi:hypothetical protein